MIEQTKSETPSIVVADDSTTVRALLSDLLRREGYQVFEASDGTEALHHVVTHNVDLVITDLVMPDREGLETIRELRKSHPSLKTIAISGAARGIYLRLAREIGADAVFAKPIDPSTLLRAVRTLLNSRANGQA